MRRFGINAFIVKFKNYSLIVPVPLLLILYVSNPSTFFEGSFSFVCFLFIYLFILLFIYLFIYLSVYLSIYLFWVGKIDPPSYFKKN